MLLFAFYWSLLKVVKFWTYKMPMRKNIGPTKYPQEILGPQNTHNKKSWTHKIPKRKNGGPTKYPQEKMLDPQNTHKKKSWTHKIPKRKNGGPTKYPQEKMLDPQNTHKKKSWTHNEKKYGTHKVCMRKYLGPTKYPQEKKNLDPRWHSVMRPTKPKMAPDPQMSFSTLNFNDVIIVSIHFPSNSKGDLLFSSHSFWVFSCQLGWSQQYANNFTIVIFLWTQISTANNVWWLVNTDHVSHVSCFINHLGKGNLIFYCTGSQENFFRLVGQQNNNNTKFQGWYI